MTTWSLEPGCERPIDIRSAMKAGVGNLSASQIAKLVEEHGARVEFKDNKYRVYPANPQTRPVFFADRFHNGNDRSNVLAALRRAGIDITAPKEEAPVAITPTPTPAQMPATKNSGSIPTVGELSQQLETVLGMLAEAESRDKTQTDQIAELAETLDQMKDLYEVLNRRVRKLEQATHGTPETSPREIVRGLVTKFFQEHRGMKLSPEMVSMNLGDSIPEGAPKTVVANACRDLARAGVLQGGGSNGKDGQPPSGHRGIYWMEQES